MRRWNLAKIDIETSNTDRFIVFEGIVGKGYQGDQVKFDLLNKNFF
jgi:hypothetical protein